MYSKPSNTFDTYRKWRRPHGFVGKCIELKDMREKIFGFQTAKPLFSSIEYAKPFTENVPDGRRSEKFLEQLFISTGINNISCVFKNVKISSQKCHCPPRLNLTWVLKKFMFTYYSIYPFVVHSRIDCCICKQLFYFF